MKEDEIDPIVKMKDAFETKQAQETHIEPHLFS